MNRFSTTPEDHAPFASYKNGEVLRQQLETIDWRTLSCSFIFAELCSILGKTHDAGLELCATEKEIRSDDFHFVVQKTHERVIWSLEENWFSAIVDDGKNFRNELDDLKKELIDYFRKIWFEPEHGIGGLTNPFDDLIFIRVAKK